MTIKWIPETGISPGILCIKKNVWNQPMGKSVFHKELYSLLVHLAGEIRVLKMGMDATTP